MMTSLMDTVKLRRCTIKFRGQTIVGEGDAFLFVSNTISSLSLKSDDYINFQRPILMKMSNHFRVIQFSKPDNLFLFEAATFVCGFIDHKALALKLITLFQILNEVIEIKKFGLRDLKIMMNYARKFKVSRDISSRNSKTASGKSTSFVSLVTDQDALMKSSVV
jgi:hypothetical protein